MNGKAMLFLVPRTVHTRRELDEHIRQTEDKELAPQMEANRAILTDDSQVFSKAFLEAYESWLATQPAVGRSRR